jgi:putative phosphoesterase
MRIGILSDSHGRADTTRKAVSLLVERNVDLLLHLGDLGSESVLEELVGQSAHIVLGNCDWNAADLARYARNLGIAVDDPMGILDIDGKRIAFTHGHHSHLIQQALDQSVDYLLYGHTHELSDQRAGKTRIINPGALFRADRYTAAVLTPARDQLEIIEIPRQT